MPTVITLAASLFEYQRVTTALWTQVPGHVQLAQLQRTIGAVRFLVAVTVVSVLALLCLLFARGLDGLHVQFKRARHGVGQRTHLLRTEAHGATPADAAQLLRDLLSTVRLRQRAQDAQVERDQTTQRLGQGRNVATCLAYVDEDLQWPMLITIHGDVDGAFRSLDVARVAMHYGGSCLQTLVNRGDRFYRRNLGRLLSCLLLVLDACEHGVARTVAVVGDAFAARLVGEAVQLLHLLDGVIVGRVDRLADAGVGVALHHRLHAYMFFRRQVLRCDEVARRGFVGVLSAPLFE